MQRIFGILSCDPSQHEPANLSAMMNVSGDALSESENQFHFNPVSLGFRQSTTKATPPCQPMTTQDRRFTVVCCGTIENASELRPQFLHPVLDYETQTDTEVLLFAYDRLEQDAFPLFQGAYTLALWDSYERRLTLAQAHHGAAPLYYFLAGGMLLFASQATAIPAHPSYSSDDQNPSIIAGLPPRVTPFPAGHYAHINPDAPLEITPVPFAPPG